MSKSGEYSRWGCIYRDPPERTPYRYEISRSHLAEKIARGEFNNLTVDMGHIDDTIWHVGRVTDAVQATKSGAVFARITIPYGKGDIAQDFAVQQIRNGGIRGLSLQHDPSNDDRKLLGVGLTPKPGRPGTFFLPDDQQPPPNMPRSQLASFSAFNSVDIYGAQGAESDSHKSNDTPSTMSSSSTTAPTTTQPAGSASSTLTNTNTPAPAATTETDAKVDGIMYEGKLATPEELKALLDYAKTAQQELAAARKLKQELEEARKAMAEKDTLLQPVLEENKNKVMRLLNGMFNYGVAAVSDAEKKQIEEVQAQLQAQVMKDPHLMTRIAQVSSLTSRAAESQPAPQSAPQPVSIRVARDAMGRFAALPDKDSDQQTVPMEPAHDRRTPATKRLRSTEELLDDYSGDSTFKAPIRAPPTHTSSRPIHPSIRQVLGTHKLEGRQAVAYSNFTAEQTRLFEEYERNRAEADAALSRNGGMALEPREFRSLGQYIEYLKQEQAASNY